MSPDIQNPNNPAPHEVLENLQMLDISHIGFDGNLHEGKILMHKSVADDVQAFFTLALELQFPIEKVIPIHNPEYSWDDEKSCNDNNSSGFNYRSITGKPGMISKHGLGYAFDINPVQNIYVRYDENLNEIYRLPSDGIYDGSVAGTLTENHPLVIFMKERGWNWGGDWKPESGRTDWQHFEKNPIAE